MFDPKAGENIVQVPVTVVDGVGLIGGAPGVGIGPEKQKYGKHPLDQRVELVEADHKLLWHEATSGFHFLEDEVGDQPPVLLLALPHQAKRAVVHLNDHLQTIMASIV